MLTKKQLQLLEFIHARVQKEGVPPSFDEMKEELGLRSKSGIHRLITGLEERGYITRLAHRARALEITRLPDALAKKSGGFQPRVIDGDRPDSIPPAAKSVESVGALELPVMGRIAAGVPIAAIQEISHNVAVPQSMIGQGEHYALEVKGDSMIDAGINDGDIVIIRETQTASNGDIVVALVEDAEATLKKFRRQNGMIALEAANPAYETRILHDHQVKVQGRLVGLIRTY
ncbi:repressor LexA [Aestuarium zhoushanense]|jgi:repressor LexA|uniref:transcriptional repressor LexA n=1 Tax=Marivivens donghaensis TaxID=1699413 RepID=UPI000CA0FBD8|nr:transcriptional repressor LexA [Marivivens donghaensis]AUJ63861.1 repressor LexA [Aestuarium zhoushanense]MCL7408018.1 transcriptional repressor LexA [Marivivens donghaensis]MDN3704003.1 transcriptional repressor LexA [Marivivens donghaensis]